MTDAKRIKFEDQVATIEASTLEIQRGLLKAAMAGRCRESRRAIMMDAVRRIEHELETF